MKTKIDNLFYEKLGNELDLQRKKLGYSYRYLAQLTGISRSQLDNYFCGKNRITEHTYKIICEALHIKPKISVEINLG